MWTRPVMDIVGKDCFYSLDLFGAILKPTRESRLPWELMLLNIITFISSQGTRLDCISYPIVVKRFLSALIWLIDFKSPLL